MTFINNTSPFLDVLDYQNRTDGEKANIDALIEYTSECIENQCGRIFTATDIDSEAHNGENDEYLVVKNPPINSLDSIVIKSVSGDITIDGDQFTYDSGSGEIRIDPFQTNTTTGEIFYCVFPRGFQNILVTYNGGFVIVPKTIEFICAEAVIEVFSRADAFQQVKTEKIGINSYKSYVAHVLFDKKKQLDRYKLRAIP